jgi:hypothetical protein
MGCSSSKQKNLKTEIYIQPLPNFVIKTQLIPAESSASSSGTDSNAKAKAKTKVFINICTNDHIWKYPSCMVGPIRAVKDKRGDECLCCDIVYHPSGIPQKGGEEEKVVRILFFVNYFCVKTNSFFSFIVLFEGDSSTKHSFNG